ncbi:polyprenyl synthetase family protein [Bacillus taeanensis]|uniref:Farnesyl diphosphate synthase n=1 Tax=Bacillus taeanensis TaxID=273032 RepID=A0A366Y335_9BACI|nr:farnesyl diphosphate synthase [Bacillus taeanensis]RBW70611.1 polyprenyl synthetase family protein [Bacillus taeanensis]
MSVQSLEIFLKEKKEVIDKQLPLYIEKMKAPTSLKEAMLYSVYAGGKRLRPILLLAAMQAFRKDDEAGLPVACAVEMVHTYSLIHDDLPCMDDDDLRRGKPTNHKMFGEAMAVLAGDALLTNSFGIIANINHPFVTSEMKVELIKGLSDAAGAEGMVGGQVADMEGEEKNLQLQELEYIHQHKTGNMIRYSVIAGAVLAQATKEQLQHLEVFADHLGLAFQIQDDILDIEGDEAVIGKPVGSDENNQKSTYPKLLTLDGAKKKLNYHIAAAKEALLKTGIDTTRLEEITNYMVTRNH